MQFMQQIAKALRTFKETFTEFVVLLKKTEDIDNSQLSFHLILSPNMIRKYVYIIRKYVLASATLTI